MKDSNYFSHDFGARNDPKLIELQMTMGGQGLAIWWCLIEMIHENGGFIKASYKGLAYSLRWADEEEVRMVVEDFGLFETDGALIWNKSALSRITKRNEAIEQRRAAGVASAENRRKINECSTTVERPLNECSTTVESSFNNKRNKINKNKESYSSSLLSSTVSISNPRTREDEAGKEQEEKEKEQIFLIFFFEKNFLEPEKEMYRFWNYYQGCGWQWEEGRPIVDKMAVARQWVPEEKKQRFQDGFRRWWRSVFDEACRCKLSWHPIAMLRATAEAHIRGDTCDLTMASEAWAENVRGFLGEHPGLTRGKKVNYLFRRA